MLQYLIILLSDRSTSFCHYSPSQKPHPRPLSKCRGEIVAGEGSSKIIPLDTLRRGIRFAMRENLMIQFVYPEEELPREILDEIETIDHSKIRPLEGRERESDADVLVLNGWEALASDCKSEATGFDVPLVLRTGKAELFERYGELKPVLSRTPRLNVVITDVETFTDEDFGKYKAVLSELSAALEQLYADGKSPQLNLLTDRMMLREMNNCGAGDTTLTLAPNGKFYVCPAFYYDDEADSVGDINAPDFRSAEDLDIRNRQLYKLDHAPICRHCDAWQCKRCVWLNRKTTLEVNTPSHEQCVVAHLERNASRELLQGIRKHGTFLPEQEEIKELDYLDPFDRRDEWK